MPHKRVRLTFASGTQEVTGANFLIEDLSPAAGGQGVRILVDCGLLQGSSAMERRNSEPFLYDPKTIDALFVTHAHMDHIGRIPKLVREGFRGAIYSTPPTKEISAFSLNDALGLMTRDAQPEPGGRNSVHRQSGPPPLYEEADIDQAMSQWQTIGYHQPVTVGDFTVVLRDSGHILGAAMVEFSAGARKLLMTGDLGNSPAPLLRDTEKISDINYLVMESVYGDRNHEDRADRRSKLEDIIEETMRRDGVLLIPAFSIERTQELLFEIENMMENSRIPLVPVFLDSPLAINVTAIYKKYKEYFNHEAAVTIRDGDGLFKFPQFYETMSTEESKAIDRSNQRKIIIAGSGMSNGGRIIHHEKKYLPDPKNTLLLVGYQSVGSLGRLIQDGAKSVTILGEEVPVRAKVVSISGYSSHKDSDRLLEFVRGSKDTLIKVFTAMGESKSSLFLVQRIRDYLGIDASAPAPGESVEIEL